MSWERCDVKKTHVLLLVLSLVIVVFFLSSRVNGIIPNGNITISFYPNESYIATSLPNINFTFIGENETYGVEFYMNDSVRSGPPQKFNDTILQNITATAPVADGVNYTWQLKISNGTQINFTRNFTLTIDTLIPLMDFNASTITNNSYISLNNFSVAFGGASDTNYLNFTIFLANQSNGAIVNTTIYNGTTLTTVDYISVAEGNYTVNVTATDRSNNKNRTLQRTVIVDLTKPLMDFNASSIVNNTYVGLNNFSVAFGGVVETNFGNITVFLANQSDGAIVNKTIYNTTTLTTVDYISVPEGNYTVNLTATDLANNKNRTLQRTVIVDLTRPLMNYNASSLVNNSNFTTGAFGVMFGSVTETNFANITVFLTNSSNGVVVNKTIYNSTDILAVNYTGLGDGNYTVNVTITDLANNKNRTVNRFVTVDSTAPTPTISLSSTSVTAGASLTISCSIIDGIDSSPSSSGITVKRPADLSYSSFAGGTWIDTSQEGTYSVQCQAGDYAGNSATKTSTFAVTAVSTGSSSGGGSSGSSSSGSAKAAPVAPPTVEQPVVASTPVSVESSDSWSSTGSVEYSDVAEGAVYELSFTTPGGETVDHRISVKAVDETAGTVTFEIASTPTEVTLAVGESKDVDLSGDGQADLKLTLNGITAGIADVSMEKIGEWIEPASVKESKKKRGLAILVFLIVALLVIVLAYFVIRGGRSAKVKKQ
ncbi:hypothetical protein HZA98_00935 [Candidatus Woesearchaeota archaeon]|nr:hypothetical protein [Candidatus Woesearchaeota archaeon]